MQAVIFREAGVPLTVEDVKIDAPTGHEVLVRRQAAGVCHSDYSLLEGHNTWPFVPCVLGHESAGVIEAVGSEVTYVKPGDHVITSCIVFCGKCEFCLSGHMSLCDQMAFMRGADQ